MSNNHSTVIINADDFGWDINTVNTTIELFEKGSLTSATIMTGHPTSNVAIEYAKANRNKFSFGLHFNIVDGHRSLSEPAVYSLLGRDGFFEESNRQRRKAVCWQIDPADIQRELETQLTSLLDSGVEVSHVDSHGHLHKYPCIINSMKPILKKYKIAYVRAPQNQFPVFKIRKMLLNRLFRIFFIGLKCSDYFFMLDNHDDSEWLVRFASSLRSGTTELGIHPGTEEHWRFVETLPFQSGQADILFSRSNVKKISFRGIES
jgi:chitin disaccharide deacetylase